LPNIEASYKSKYNSEFSDDCKKLTYQDVITRIMNIDDDSFGEVIKLRSLEINNFDSLKGSDSKTIRDYKKRAKKVMTENRKNKKKNQTPKINDVIKRRVEKNISEFLE
jgi:hypothetical protein